MKSRQKNSLTLCELVSKFHVGFRIQPGEAAVVSGRTAQMIYRLRLTGRHDGRDKHEGTSCPTCIQVLQTMFEIIDALRPIEREAVARTGGVCETHAHYASVCGPGHEATLGLKMVFKSLDAAESADWTWNFAQSVRVALAKLGCRNLAPAEPVGCRPPFPAARRGQMHNDAVGGDAAGSTSRWIA